MNPRDFLASAQIPLSAGGGDPTSVSLCRSVGSAHDALLHGVARQCADHVIGTTTLDREGEPWRRVYRSLEHSHASRQRRQRHVVGELSHGIQDFAGLFVVMQTNRLLAVERTLARFEAASDRDRRAFCAFVLLRDRKS